MTIHSDAAVGSPQAERSQGTREDQLSRLDQLEREIARERERLNRPDDSAASDARSDRTERDGTEQGSAVHRLDLPELEERVTESQREAWALGYQAGVADSQTRTGERTPNPFHPLRG